MNVIRIVLLALLLLTGNANGQNKYISYKLEKGQNITVEVLLEAGAVRTGKMLITVDSIDERGGAFVTIAPANATAVQRGISTDNTYMAGATIKAILTPRGELRFGKTVGISEPEWRMLMATDTIYRHIWGAEYKMMVTQFLFPFLPRSSHIAIALDRIDTAVYVQRGISHEIKDGDSISSTQEIVDNSAYHIVRTLYRRSKPFIFKGEKLYHLSRFEDEDEQNCLVPSKPKMYRHTRTTEWIIRERDGAMLREQMISYKVDSDGAWQGVVRTYDALGPKFQHP